MVECSVRPSRKWVIANLLVAVIGGSCTVISEWLGWDFRRASPGETVWLGRMVSFDAPAGWQLMRCGNADQRCVSMLTPEGTQHVITVSVYTPVIATAPPAGSAMSMVTVMEEPASWPEARFFTIDDVQFVRARWDAADWPGPAVTVVRGELPNGDTVSISCQEWAEPKLVRAGCKVVIDTLHIRR